MKRGKLWITKHIGLPRILSSFFLVRLSIQNFLARLSLRRLRSRRFLLMLLVLTLFFSFISPRFSSPVSVVADSGTVTPTATFHALFPSPTPGLSPLDCSGVPVGLGTVTPNPAWLALCSHCMPTSTLYPTSTRVWNGTGTPIPSSTLSLTSTPTAIATMSGATLTLGTITHSNPNGWGEITSHNISCSAYYNGVKCDFSYSQSVASGNRSSQDAVQLIGSGGGSTFTSYIVADTNATGQYWYQWPQIQYPFVAGTFSTGSAPATGKGVQHLTTTITPTGGSNGGFTSTYTVGMSNGAFSFTGTVYYMPQPVLPTPMPATPMPVTYCSVIDNNADTSSFGLPVITAGEDVCGGAGGLIIPFSWFQLIGFNLDDLVVPRINMCFTPISFGQLKLAGNIIDLDVIAYILGALVLFWLVL